MDDARKEQVLREYLRLEDAFLELTQYVPLVVDLGDGRYGIASPRAAEFGLDCGTWIETLFRELLNDPRWNGKVTGIEEARNETSPNLDTYRRAFGGELGWAQAGYALRGTAGPEVRPFEAWGRDENPEWFRTYSRYKHDRFELARAFTMGHALHAHVALVMLVNHWLPGSVVGLDRPRSRVLEGV